LSSDIHTTAHHWNETTARFSGRNLGLCWWEAGPEIHNRINRKISGDPNCDYSTYTLKKYFDQRLPLDRCLSLGCGSGGLERSLARQGAFKHCDAYDIAEGSLQIAKNLAEEEGLKNIKYFIADINKLILPPNSYDAVWIQGAMHHFESLEHVCNQMRQALKPEGLLILNEYIGPNRFQFPARQKQVANLCLQLLPQKYRFVSHEAVAMELKRSPSSKRVKWFVSRLADKIRDGDLMNLIQRRFRAYKSKITGQSLNKNTITFPSVNDVITADPSEAVRSEEIVSILQEYFEIVEKKELGGNILQFLLADIAVNFNKEDQHSQSLLRMLINIEETLLLCGEFNSDFAYIVARPSRK